ncbi:NAD(P)/FAD-dependent oxidoreductase [Pelagibacterium montanilacus]|uniref:NAD(P)/FAD-dependent oxidoreductase n=1 Tax=Pelagibacterium montanilacus TaxID=2185280 RepID=UPI000F8D43C7|nr:FAD-binding oxidoreductase [Pelagibacterium montanilacus]
MARRDYDTVIVGAGVIGLSIAYRLAASGVSVLILDRKGMAEEASRGNAGAYAFADIEPLASPGVMFKAPGWLFDPLGPLSIPLGYAPRIAPWLMRFFRASWPDRLEASTRAQAALMDLARARTEPMLKEAGLAHHLRKDGAIYLYSSEASWRASLPMWSKREAHAIPFEHVSGARLAELQPGLGPRYTHGTFLPQWMTVSDPYQLTLGIGKAALARGATFRQAEVARLDFAEDGARVVLADGSTIGAGHVVVAAGAWSHKLAATIGQSIPLETERGYNTTFPPRAFDLRRQLVLPEDGYVISPLDTGIRVGGAVELGGLDRKPDFRRSEALVRKASCVLPGLETADGVQWMGFRPSMPDSLPVIGPSAKTPRVLYAFGHGHLGLTQSAATAHIIADLVRSNVSCTDIKPYSSARF